MGPETPHDAAQFTSPVALANLLPTPSAPPTLAILLFPRLSCLGALTHAVPTAWKPAPYSWSGWFLRVLSDLSLKVHALQQSLPFPASLSQVPCHSAPQHIVFSLTSRQSL